MYVCVSWKRQFIWIVNWPKYPIPIPNESPITNRRTGSYYTLSPKLSKHSTLHFSGFGQRLPAPTTPVLSHSMSSNGVSGLTWRCQLTLTLFNRGISCGMRSLACSLLFQKFFLRLPCWLLVFVPRTRYVCISGFNLSFSISINLMEYLQHSHPTPTYGK